MPRKAHNKKSHQSNRPKTAVLTVNVVGSESYKKPLTEEELTIQDREGVNTMFLVEVVTVKGDSQTMPVLMFHDNGSNMTMIRNELAKKLGLAGCEVKQKLVRSGGDVMDWKTTAYKVLLLLWEWRRYLPRSSLQRWNQPSRSFPRSRTSKASGCPVELWTC